MNWSIPLRAWLIPLVALVAAAYGLVYLWGWPALVFVVAILVGFWLALRVFDRLLGDDRE